MRRSVPCLHGGALPRGIPATGQAKGHAPSAGLGRSLSLLLCVYGLGCGAYKRAQLKHCTCRLAAHVIAPPDDTESDGGESDCESDDNEEDYGSDWEGEDWGEEEFDLEEREEWEKEWDEWESEEGDWPDDDEVEEEELDEHVIGFEVEA